MVLGWLLEVFRWLSLHSGYCGLPSSHGLIAFGSEGLTLAVIFSTEFNFRTLEFRLQAVKPAWILE